MSVRTFTEKYITVGCTGGRHMKMCGGFEFTEPEVDEGALQWSLCKLRQTLLDKIDEAIKELHKITE